MIAQNPWKTRLSVSLSRLWPLLSVACLAPACGESRTDPTEVDDLGAACGEARVVDDSVEIDDGSGECQGVCLRGAAVAPPGTTSAGQCSCRCDGPAGTGPFCDCAAGYSCEHQIEDVGAGEQDLAGSYCVRRR